MTLLLRPAAVLDIAAAREFYAEVGGDVHRRFGEDLDRLFARLLAFPRSAPTVDGYPSIRRAILRRFPHAVFYLLGEPDTIDVLRILHTSRNV